MNFYSLTSVVVFSALALGCSRSPVSPAVTGISVPAAPPQALLSIDSGDVTPALAITGVTPLIFDASRSTGSSLTYRIDFGDGTSTANSIAAHVPSFASSVARDVTATLTVTDSVGRTASTTQRYFVATLKNDVATFWSTTDAPLRILTVTVQDGATFSGWFQSLETGTKAVMGTITAPRTITLRSADGELDFTGTIGWRTDSQWAFSQGGIVLRLVSAKGSPVQFEYADPY